MRRGSVLQPFASSRSTARTWSAARALRRARRSETRAAPSSAASSVRDQSPDLRVLLGHRLGDDVPRSLPAPPGRVRHARFSAVDVALRRLAQSDSPVEGSSRSGVRSARGWRPALTGDGGARASASACRGGTDPRALRLRGARRGSATRSSSSQLALAPGSISRIVLRRRSSSSAQGLHAAPRIARICHLVEVAGRFLAVAGDEGDGVAVVEEAQHRHHTARRELQLARHPLIQVAHGVPGYGPPNDLRYGRVSTPKRVLLWLLAVFYVVAGLNHFLSPAVYRPMMPAYLPGHDALIFSPRPGRPGVIRSLSLPLPSLSFGLLGSYFNNSRKPLPWLLDTLLARETNREALLAVQEWP